MSEQEKLLRYVAQRIRDVKLDWLDPVSLERIADEVADLQERLRLAEDKIRWVEIGVYGLTDTQMVSAGHIRTALKGTYTGEVLADPGGEASYCPEHGGPDVGTGYYECGCQYAAEPPTAQHWQAIEKQVRRHAERAREAQEARERKDG